LAESAARPAGHEANSESENKFEGKFSAMALSPAQVGIAGGTENNLFEQQAGGWAELLYKAWVCSIDATLPKMVHSSAFT